MGFEIERKFLPLNEDWKKESQTTHQIRQGYIARSDGNTVRVRISKTSKRTRAMMCVKGTLTNEGVPEEELPLEVDQAERILLMCGDRVIEKFRHHIKYAGHTFEVDEFLGRLAGHVLIEVELDSVDEHVDLPTWVGQEVTDDRAYTNAKLATNGWPKQKLQYDPIIQTPPMIQRS